MKLPSTTKNSDFIIVLQTHFLPLEKVVKTFCLRFGSAGRRILIVLEQDDNNFIKMQTDRTVPPEGKVVYYRSDGTGRDTYIRDHNGGLLTKDRIHKMTQFKAPK